MAASVTAALQAGLVEACDSGELFNIELTPRQRELLEQVEQGNLLHVWSLGRRSGKTLLGALVALHFCLLRPDLAKHVRRREKRYAVCVATNLRQARLFVAAARSVVEGSPLLAALIESVSDDEVVFRNRTVLAAFPCTSRGGRGWPVQFLLLDECAHMLDSDGNQAAEPVFRALFPSTAQFGEEGRVLVASTPYGLDGFFHDLYADVEKGALQDAIHARASTMQTRPDFPRAVLDLERARDPEGFRSEYDAEWVAAGDAYLDSGRIAAAVTGAGESQPGDVIDAIAAIDLGFVHDATALCIVGRDPANRQRLRLALARAWTPKLGPLGFSPTLDEIASFCRAYGVTRLYCDQHAAVPAVEHLARHGLRATSIATTPHSKSEMFASLKTRVYGSTLDLYEHAPLLAELARIETVTTPGAASVRIRRLGHSHGDVATALALACSRFRGEGTGMRTFLPSRRLDLTRRPRRGTLGDELRALGIHAYDATRATH